MSLTCRHFSIGDFDVQLIPNQNNWDRFSAFPSKLSNFFHGPNSFFERKYIVQSVHDDKTVAWTKRQFSHDGKGIWTRGIHNANRKMTAIHCKGVYVVIVHGGNMILVKFFAEEGSKQWCFPDTSTPQKSNTKVKWRNFWGRSHSSVRSLSYVASREHVKKDVVSTYFLFARVLNAIKKFPYERRIKTSTPNVVDSLVLLKMR